MTTTRSRRRGLALQAAAALAVLLAAGPATSGAAAAGVAAASALVPVNGANPYPAGCFDPARAGFGQGFTGAETEVTLAVDPQRPDRMVAAWMQDLYAGYQAAESTDGGATWRTSVVPGVSECSGGDLELGVDPWLTIAPDGTAYLAGFSLDLPDDDVPTPVRSRIQVSTLTPGGVWSAPAVVADDLLTLHDKPAVVADPTRPGTAYLVWTQDTTAFGPVSTGAYLSTTVDSGRTWSRPRAVVVPDVANQVPLGAQIVVLPDGSVVVVVTVMPSIFSDVGRVLPSTLRSIRSSDGGRTWSAPVDVATIRTGTGTLHAAEDRETGEQVQAPSAFASVGSGPDGTVYAVWRHAVSDTASEIRLSRSADGGRSWSPPRVVAAPGAVAWSPQVAVARDGTVGVAWYDTRADRPGDPAFSGEVWLATSRDAGTTWAEEPLTGRFDLRQAPLREVPAEGRFLGDYVGFEAVEGGFAAALPLPAPYASTGRTDVLLAVRRGLTG